MNIELIDNENPSRFWVSINRAVNVSGEIFFCTSCLNRWRNQLPFSNVPVANQSDSPVANIFKFNAFYSFWFHGVRGISPLQGLDTCHFIGTDHMDTLLE